MALLDIARRQSRALGVGIAAVTLDHGLRPEAEGEIALVAKYCAKHGLAHHVLTWSWDGRGNLQDAARKARYHAIAELAGREGWDAVALGHTQDDVAESFLMRLSRAAGVDGLAAMERDFSRDGMRWLRPLLAVGRAELRQYLQAEGVDWAEDPSNQDPHFTRVQARQALKALDPIGLDAPRLARVAQNMAKTRSALDEIARAEAKRCMRVEAGDVLLDVTDPLSAEITRRLFTTALRFVSGAPYAPREDGVCHATAELMAGRAVTLAGCYMSADRSDRRHVWRISREFNAVEHIATPTDQIWDRRWRLDGPHAPGLAVRALGDAVAQCPDWRETGLPRSSLLASPAIWSRDELVAAPLAGLPNHWAAELATARDDFAAFLIAR
jgi:tRNA(Ile)-lysidine synthase